MESEEVRWEGKRGGEAKYMALVRYVNLPYYEILILENMHISKLGCRSRPLAPAGTEFPAKRIYLRSTQSNHTYRLG